jgi:carboxyl-terminal processing protease
MDGEGGIGISAKYNVEKGRLFITEVHQGSSAENAELQVDDAIIKVDDEQVNASNVSDIIESLQFGRRFDSVTITYERDGSRKTVTVLRGETKTAFSSYIGDVGYIRISGFYANTAAQFSAELDKLNSQGITSLILDLRGCDEGSADYAAAVADLLLPSGVESAEAIAKVVKKDGSVYKNYTSDTKAITFPNGIIVMVDGGTSGGAELLAAQLKSFSKGRLLGVSTAGNMTFQEIYALEDGSAISLTVAKVVANNNETYCEGEGIEPDIVAEIDPASVPATSIEGYDGDAQLQAAYNILTQ